MMAHSLALTEQYSNTPKGAFQHKQFSNNTVLYCPDFADGQTQRPKLLQRDARKQSNAPFSVEV